jgi:glycosyltransferase involved in cell wall biosynthesis
VTVLNIVVPCYNEAEVLPETARVLSALLDRMARQGLVEAASGIWFVDDGSRDATWDIVTALWTERPDRFHGIRLSRNRGHQNALLAGLRTAPGDALVSIDADLQDDEEAIADMVRRLHAGCDIVFGVRAARNYDTRFKRGTAWLYYRLLHRFGIEAVPDHADFRLMSRRALTALERYGEVNLFLRAIVPLLGFRTAEVRYERRPRFAGESKYPLPRMLGLAIDGITSFSMQPLRLITLVGVAVSALAFLVGLWAVAAHLLSSDTVPGWTSVVVPIAFLGGLQLLSMGVIGEYVGKIYIEVKRRPHFEVDQIL